MQHNSTDISRHDVKWRKWNTFHLDKWAFYSPRAQRKDRRPSTSGWMLRRFQQISYVFTVHRVQNRIITQESTQHCATCYMRKRKLIASSRKRTKCLRTESRRRRQAARNTNKRPDMLRTGRIKSQKRKISITEHCIRQERNVKTVGHRHVAVMLRWLLP